MRTLKLSGAAKNLKLGEYEHYKNKKRYIVLGVAAHSETLEELVIYQANYGKKLLWARPLKMFLEKMKYKGELVPRFTKTENPRFIPHFTNESEG